MRDRLTRTIVATAFLASVILPLRAAAAAEPPAPDPDVAAGFQLNSSHDGRAGGTERPPLTKAWVRELGGPVSYPVIAGGKVFVTVAGASGSRLYALDAATGNDVWGPVVAGDMLTYGAGRIFAVNRAAELRAFDAATGRLEWAVHLRARAIASPPTYRNGRVFTHGDSLVEAVAEEDGRLLWNRWAPANGGSSSPAVTDTGVYVSFAANEAYGFDPATGTVLWHNPAKYVSGEARTSVVADGRLWVRDPLAWHDGTPDLVLNPATGAVTGTYRSDFVPAFDGHTGFFTVGRVLEARDTTSGALLWSFGGDGELGTAPIVVNGFVYVGSLTGRLWALDASSGAPVWGDDVGVPIRYSNEGSAGGLGVGQGLLVVPANSLLVAYAGAAPGVRAPYITSVLGDTITPALGRDTTPTVVVTGVAAGETVAVRDGAAVLATKTVAASATSVTFNAGPSGADATVNGDRDHVLSAIVVGGDLNRPSPSFTYALDTAPPPAPSITVEGGSRTEGRDMSPLIAVSGVVARDTITVVADGTARATRVMPSAGTTAYFNVVGLAPEIVLAGLGDHILSATATDPAGNVSGPSAAATYTSLNDPGRFHAQAPVRILDTRDGTGGIAGRLGPGGTISVPTAGRGGVPASGASAVVVNMAVTEPSAAGFLTVFPSGTARPLASSLNFVAGQTVSNLVVARLGPDGRVSIYNNVGTTHVVLDVLGWYHDEGDSTGALYNPLSPSRILDTRDGTGANTGRVGQGGTISVLVGGRGGVPAGGVSAVVVNVAVTEPTAAGFLTVFPSGTARPLASSLNFVAGQTVSNLVMAKLGWDGKISIYNAWGAAHVIVDVVGWYGEDDAPIGSRFSALSPSRILDTRNGTGGITDPVGPGGTMTIPVAGRGGVPASGAAAVVANITVTEPTTAGFLTVFPSGAARPLASSLNFATGQTVPNLVVAKLGPDGKLSIYNAWGTAHVVIDVVGWYGG